MVLKDRTGDIISVKWGTSESAMGVRDVANPLCSAHHIGKQEEAKADGEVAKTDAAPIISMTEPVPPIHWSKPRAMDWVRGVLVRTRGKELPGNFNPLLVGELFRRLQGNAHTRRRLQ